MTAARLALVAVVALVSGAAGSARSDPAAQGVLLFIADDWSAPHAGTYGEPAVRTPTLDRLARRGLVCEQAFAAAPVCAPSRAAILTGRPVGALGEAANQGGRFPDTLVTFPECLAVAGWAVGHAGKGWGPGRLAADDPPPAGRRQESLVAFLAAVPRRQSFHFWHGSRAPHRPYEAGAGQRTGKGLADAPLPGWLPDAAEVRADLLDYVARVEDLDRELAALLRDLDACGRADATTVIVTSDHGMPFPRAKANVYDAGTRVPLVIRGGSPGARIVRGLVALTDLAPTMLELAGSAPFSGMEGRSLAALLRGGVPSPAREAIVLARERHEHARAGGLGYPIRALRTRDHLYVRNLRPRRNAAGDARSPDGTTEFADVDPSPTKTWMLEQLPPDDSRFAAAFGPRPAEELYDLAADPEQRDDIARRPASAALVDSLRHQLEAAAADAHDPRAAEIAEVGSDLESRADPFDRFSIPVKQGKVGGGEP